MDERFIYLLNGLLTRQFALGRVARFRQIQRGRQAHAVEILTAESREFTVYLYSAAYDRDRLERLGPLSEELAQQRFPVMPFVLSGEKRFTAEGPQGQGMLVSLNPVGQAMDAPAWTAQMMSSLGLKMAWMHNLLGASPQAPGQASLRGMVEKTIAEPSARLPRFDPNGVQHLLTALDQQPESSGAIHGDMSPAAVLLDDDRQIRSLVDWGMAGVGDPHEDLLDVLVGWCIAPDQTVKTELLRALMEAYRSQRPLTQDHERTWRSAATQWLARQIVTAGAERRSLPRGFSRMFTNPAGLVDTMVLGEPK